MSLLIVGENVNFNERLSTTIGEKTYKCVTCSTIDSAKETITKSRFDLILIDMDFFKNNSISSILDFKMLDKKLSIIIVANDFSDKESEIEVLNRGADDFVKQPFSGDANESKYVELLIARIETRLRFGGTNVIEIENLIIDPDEEKIFFEGKEIELKGKPFEVLTHLAKHKGQIVSKEQLLDAIWEEPELVTPNVIEVAINQIRQKMDKPLDIGTIETVRRRGYRFCFPKCNKETNIVTA